MQDQSAAMKDMDRMADSMAGKVERIATNWKEAQMSIAVTLRGAGGLISGRPAETPGQEQERRSALLTGATSLLYTNPITAALAESGLITPATTAKLLGESGGTKDSGEKIANPIVAAIDKLMHMLEGHG
jgi:hypothetical protein